ncbi:MAG: manganese efflux pump [Bacteroidota bacterium]
MDFTSIILIAIGLSLDCFAISMTGGIILKERKLIKILQLSLLFGVFHIFMPVIGWLLGFKLKSYIQDYDHWIAFLLLSLIGFKMLYEGIRCKKTDNEILTFSKLWPLLGLAIASSIDALVVGISLAVIDISIYITAIIIGSVTFIITFLGGILGNKISKYIKFRMDIIGGIVLILIGIKILIEHMV